MDLHSIQNRMNINSNVKYVCSIKKDEINKLSKEGKIKEAYDKTLKPAYGDTVDQKDIIIE